MTRKAVQLAWALVEGRLAHVSEFEDIPPGSRPEATCEVCGRPLVMKLGAIRTHHYAHDSSVGCALQNPETARHYNTKHLIASKLRTANQLWIVTKCRQAHCLSGLLSLAAEAWDEVRVEPLVDPVRPDVLLLRHGANVLAIEVRATHAVPDAKAAQLAVLGIPWIEVVAGGECDDWKAGRPMPAIRHESEPAPKLCLSHAVRGGVASQARNRKEGANGTDVNLRERWRFRVVDCYPARGCRVRKVYWVCREVTSRATRLLLVEEANDRGPVVLAQTEAPTASSESLRELNDRLRCYLAGKYAHFDSPRSWADGGEYPSNPANVYKQDFMPVKYRRDSNGIWAALD